MQSAANSDVEGRPRDISLGIDGFSYGDLFRAERLEELLAAFDASLRSADGELFQAYAGYRENQGADLDDIAISELLVELAPHMGAFTAKLFGVENERRSTMERTRHDYAALFTYKRTVVDKVGAKFKTQNPSDWDLDKLDSDLAILPATIRSSPRANPVTWRTRTHRWRSCASTCESIHRRQEHFHRREPSRTL
jgi:hypothetical protein